MDNHSEFRRDVETGQVDDENYYRKYIIASLNRMMSDEGMQKRHDTVMCDHIQTCLIFIQNGLRIYPELFFSVGNVKDTTAEQPMSNVEPPRTVPSEVIPGRSQAKMSSRKVSENNPKMVVDEQLPPNVHENDDLSNDAHSTGDQTVESDVSYELTSYVVCHLFRVLVVPEFLSVHPAIQSLIVSILRAAINFKPYVFTRIVSELVHSFHDLATYYDKYFDPDLIEFTATLNRFGALSGAPNIALIPRREEKKTVAAEVSMSSAFTIVMNYEMIKRSINLPNPESCEQLQIHISAILCEIAPSICLYSAEQQIVVINETSIADQFMSVRIIDVIWAGICVQLEFGECDLKSVTLQLALRLLNDSFPSHDIFMLFVNFLVVIVDMLVSGFSECDGNFERLETIVGDVINFVTLGVENDRRLSHNDRGEVMTLIFEELVTSLTMHGTARLRTSSLRQGLFVAIAMAMRIRMLYNSVQYETEADRYLALTDRILSELTASDSELDLDLSSNRVIAPLRYIIQEELRAYKCRERVSIVGNGNAPSPMRENEIPEKSVQNCSNSKTTLPNSTSVIKNSLCVMSVIAARLVTNIERLSWEIAQSNEATVKLSSLRAQAILLEVLIGCIDPDQQLNDRLDNDVIPSLPDGSSMEIFSSDQTSNIISGWITFLGGCRRDKIDTTVIRSYRTIVSCMRPLLTSRVLCGISDELLLMCAAILSIPWLACELNWLDLSVPASEKTWLASISNALSEKLHVEIVCDCVHLLCLIQRQIGVQWRIQVYISVVVFISAVIRDNCGDASCINIRRSSNTLHFWYCFNHNTFARCISTFVWNQHGPNWLIRF